MYLYHDVSPRLHHCNLTEKCVSIPLFPWLYSLINSALPSYTHTRPNIHTTHNTHTLIYTPHTHPNIYTHTHPNIHTTHTHPNIHSTHNTHNLIYTALDTCTHTRT